MALQDQISVIEENIKTTEEALPPRARAPQARERLKELKSTHRALVDEAEALFDALDVGGTLPSIGQHGRAFVRELVLTQHSLIRLRAKAVAQLMEYDKLDQAVGGRNVALGTSPRDPS